MARRHGNPLKELNLHLQYDGELTEDGSVVTSFLSFLEQNPKLRVWSDRFWMDPDHDMICHKLEMNRYGCRGTTIDADSIWPVLIEKLGQLDATNERQHDLETGAPNILYSLLRRHPGLFED